MGSSKISAISAEQTTAVATDIYEIETAGGTSKRTLLSTIRDYILGYVTSLSSKASVVSADEILINDSADSNAPKKVTAGALGLVPPGVTLPFMGSGSAPSGFLLCDGTSYLRATYPDLFTAIGVLYGSVDGTHFNVPDLAGRYLQGYESGVSEAIGTAQGSSAPNITGQIDVTNRDSDAVDVFDISTGSGALSASDISATRSLSTGTTLAGVGARLNFDASDSSSVYQTTTRIQTDNYACQFIIKT